MRKEEDVLFYENLVDKDDLLSERYEIFVNRENFESDPNFPGTLMYYLAHLNELPEDGAK